MRGEIARNRANENPASNKSQPQSTGCTINSHTVVTCPQRQDEYGQAAAAATAFEWDAITSFCRFDTKCCHLLLQHISSCFRGLCPQPYHLSSGASTTISMQLMPRFLQHLKMLARSPQFRSKLQTNLLLTGTWLIPLSWMLVLLLHMRRPSLQLMTSLQNQISWISLKNSRRTHQRIKLKILQWVLIRMTTCWGRLRAWTRSGKDQAQRVKIKVMHQPRRENNLNLALSYNE